VLQADQRLSSRLLEIEQRNDFKDLLWKQGGANLTPPSGFRDGFNFIYTPGGNLKLRAGFQKLNVSSLNAPIMGLKQVPWRVSGLLTAVAAGAGIFIWDETLDTFVEVWDGQTPGHKTCFDAYAGNLLFANGIDSMRYYNGSVCKETIPPTNGWYGDLTPDTVIVWKDRAWAAVGPMIYASDLQIPYDFLNGTATQFPTGDDNPIKCFVPAFDKLFVIKDKSVGYISQEVSSSGGSWTYSWTYTSAYSSVFGTPSKFGGCGHGEAVYYGAPDGLFEITNTGREGLGNFNTTRIEQNGIGSYFDAKHCDALHFNSFENLIVVPHFGRNEIWFFVGRMGNSIDTILVYCRDLKRWTQFTVPACQVACSYITNAYQRVVAIGTEDGFVAISDQTVDGKDLDVDFVGNSYVDFMWNGNPEAFKSFRLFAPFIQCEQFKYSTVFDEARLGVTNVPVSVGLDAISHLIPIELDGRGLWMRTRISGHAGYWPLEISGLTVGSKVVRQKQLSNISCGDSWSLPAITDFTKKPYPIAGWAQTYGLLRFYAGNDRLIPQSGNCLMQDMVIDNTITIGAARGGGFVLYIIGIYLATEIFEGNDPWAAPANPAAVNYYTGGAFTNTPDVFLTEITLGTPLSTGTLVIVKYLYSLPTTDITAYALPIYTPVTNYPWIQSVDSNTLVPSAPLSGVPDFLIYEFWKDQQLFPTNATGATAAVKFLWKALLSAAAVNVLNYGPLISFSTIISGLIGPSGTSPTPNDVTLVTNFQPGLSTVTPVITANPDPARNLPISDNVSVTTNFETLEDLGSYGLNAELHILAQCYGAYFGIELHWPKLVMQQIGAMAFDYQGSQSGQVVLCSLIAEDGNIYSAGFPDLSENILNIGIALNQFYKQDTIFWDGIRIINPTILSYYATSGSRLPTTQEVLDTAFFSPEGDLLHGYIELQNALDDTGNFVASWMKAEVDLSEANYQASAAGGLSFLYRAAFGPATPAVTVVVASGAGTSTYNFNAVPNNQWISQTVLWSDFDVAPTGKITSVYISVTDSTDFCIADMCYCDLSRDIYKLRYSDNFSNVNSLIWSIQDNPGYKIYYLYDQMVTYTYYTPGYGTIGPGETLHPIQHTGTRLALTESGRTVIDTGALGTVSLAITNLAVNLKVSNAFLYTWPSLLGYLPNNSTPIFSGGVLTCYSPIFSAWIANQITPVLEHTGVSLANRKRLISEGAAAYTARYNIAGPIVPANSCVATEALGLFKGFNTFDWYRKWANTELCLYHFNSNLIDSSLEGQDLSWSSGSPTYVSGLCFPVNTAIQFDGTDYAYGGSSIALGQTFSIMMIIKGAVPTSDNLIIAQKYAGSGYGFQITTGLTGSSEVILTAISSLGTTNLPISGALDETEHLVVWTITPEACTGYLDNAAVLSTSDDIGNIDNTTALHIGGTALVTIDMFGIEAKPIPYDQIVMMWTALNGDPNQMSLIPAATTGIGQYLAFANTAKYRVMSGDTSVDEFLDNFVTWLDTNILSLGGNAYQPPQYFNQYGYSYGTEINPTFHGLILQGLIYYYWYSGSSTANTWIGRLMDDLRDNLVDPDSQLFLSRG